MSTSSSSSASNAQKKKQAAVSPSKAAAAKTKATQQRKPVKKVQLDDPGTAIPEDLSPLEQLRREREKARLRLERLKAEQLKAQVVTEQIHNEQLKAEKLAEMAQAEERKAEVISEQKVAAELKAKKEAKMREKALKEALKQAEQIKAEQAAIEREAEERRNEQKRLKLEAAKLRKEKVEAQKLVERQQAARQEAAERAAKMEAKLKEEEERERRLAAQLEEQERQEQKEEAARRRAAQDMKLKAARQREGQSTQQYIPSPEERRKAAEAKKAASQPSQPAQEVMNIPALKSGDTGKFVTRDTLDPEAIMMQKIVDDLDAGYQPVKSKHNAAYAVSNKPAYHEDKSFPTINIAVAIVQKKNKFLLVQEKKGWYFPAGRPVGNESMVEAAKREALYKGGLEVEAKGVVRVEHTIMPKYARLRSIFLCKQTCTNEPKQEANAQSFRAAWFELKDLEKIKLRTQEVVPIMEAMMDGYNVAPMSFYTIEGAPW